MRFRSIVVLASLGAAAVLALLAWPGPDGATGGPAAPAGTFAGPLDGMDFTGTLRPVDGSRVVDDTLHFREGHFWSGSCVECNFAPGPYWTRRAGEAVEFRGVLESPDRGRFVYEGSVEDGRIEVAINWRRDRWYWSIDRDFVFEGRLDETAETSGTLDEARARAAAEPLPTCAL